MSKDLEVGNNLVCVGVACGGEEWQIMYKVVRR